MNNSITPQQSVRRRTRFLFGPLLIGLVSAVAFSAAYIWVIIAESAESSSEALGLLYVPIVFVIGYGIGIVTFAFIHSRRSFTICLVSLVIIATAVPMTLATASIMRYKAYKKTFDNDMTLERTSSTMADCGNIIATTVWSSCVRKYVSTDADLAMCLDQAKGRKALPWNMDYSESAEKVCQDFYEKSR